MRISTESKRNTHTDKARVKQKQPHSFYTLFTETQISQIQPQTNLDTERDNQHHRQSPSHTQKTEKEGITNTVKNTQSQTEKQTQRETHRHTQTETQPHRDPPLWVCVL